MKTVRINRADLLKAETVFQETGFGYSAVPNDIFVVCDALHEALAAAGVRMERRPAREGLPVWMRPPSERKAFEQARMAAK
jgi:hypothetical protein